MKLKIHTDLSLLAFGAPVDFLIPFIGIDNEEYSEGRLYAHTFDDYCEFANTFIELTSLAECDACLFPIYYDPAWNDTGRIANEIQAFIARVEQSKKKVFVYVGHDIHINKVNINNAVLFSGAINKSTQAPNVYSYPHFFYDLLAYNQTTFSSKPKSKLPVVGFCGYAPPLKIKLGKEKIISFAKLVANYTGILRFFPDRISHSYRARAIIALTRSPKIKTNFKIKGTFAFGPTGQLNTNGAGESDTDFRKNFINNILESDYTLCVRGIGNNSIRFFETLCCGRIPVFVNTDSVLPFDHLIEWKKLCVWVEEKDIDRIGDAISAFHNSISDDDYAQLQRKLREIWVEYLSPLGFYKNARLFL